MLNSYLDLNSVLFKMRVEHLEKNYLFLLS